MRTSVAVLAFTLLAALACGGDKDRETGVLDLCKQTDECCEVCTDAQACGDGCIPTGAECDEPRGCSCNVEEVCS